MAIMKSLRNFSSGALIALLVLFSSLITAWPACDIWWPLNFWMKRDSAVQNVQPAPQTAQVPSAPLDDTQKILTSLKLKVIIVATLMIAAGAGAVAWNQHAAQKLKKLPQPSPARDKETQTDDTQQPTMEDMLAARQRLRPPAHKETQTDEAMQPEIKRACADCSFYLEQMEKYKGMYETLLEHLGGE